MIRLAEITDSEDHLRKDDINEDEEEEEEEEEEEGDKEDRKSDSSDDETSKDGQSDAEEDHNDGFDGSTLIPSEPWSPPTVHKRSKVSPP